MADVFCDLFGKNDIFYSRGGHTLMDFEGLFVTIVADDERDKFCWRTRLGIILVARLMCIWERRDGWFHRNPGPARFHPLSAFSSPTVSARLRLSIPGYTQM